jgi:phytoene dehydrogenase-like protein
MSQHDAIVIGADVGGLAAAALLGRAGKRVLLLEREAAPAEPIGPVYALDPLLMHQLKLAAKGLSFIQRDLPLCFIDHAQIVLGRDPHDAALALAALGTNDSRAWAPFRREVHRLARQLRDWWWSGLAEGTPGWVLDNAKTRSQFARLSVTGADAFLASHFQSEALIAALLFDASAGGFHVSEPGSALALVWRTAQAMAGLEGAVAMPAPGTLIWSLIKAVGDADFRCCAQVAEILTEDGQVRGVRLTGGAVLEAPLVLSSLDRSGTMALTGAPAPLPRIGEARLLISLKDRIDFPPLRLVVAKQPEIYADAHEAAWHGKLPAELPMEFSASAPDRIAVTMRPVPARLTAEDRVQLAARAVQVLTRHIPGAASLVGGLRFSISTPERAGLNHLIAPPLARVQTKIAGLYLCGAAAEPVASLSGRAARIAVEAALKNNSGTSRQIPM